MTKKSAVLIGLAAAALLAIFLSKVFSGAIVLPQTLSVGRFAIRYYGLIMALAVASAYAVALARAKRFSISTATADSLMIWLVVGGFIGARLYHVASDARYYYHHLGQVVQVWQGGLSIYGAVLGGLVALVIHVRLNPKPLTLTPILDWLAPSVIVGQIIGRFGNLLNYELYGYPTNLPWKMFVPEQFRVGGFIHSAFFHPLFLYEALANSIVLLILLKLDKKAPRGALFLWYVLLYNTVRFCLEFLRIDSVFLGSIRQNALVSAVLALIAGIFLVYTYVQRQSQTR